MKNEGSRKEKKENESVKGEGSLEAVKFAKKFGKDLEKREAGDYIEQHLLKVAERNSPI